MNGSLFLHAIVASAVMLAGCVADPADDGDPVEAEAVLASEPLTSGSEQGTPATPERPKDKGRPTFDKPANLRAYAIDDDDEGDPDDPDPNPWMPQACSMPSAASSDHSSKR